MNKEVSREDMYFLWHPGTEETFSGYGLAIQPGNQDRLVGLLMIDRPYPVDPGWLMVVRAKFGEYALYPMTVKGERGMACQMWVEAESQIYLRQFGLLKEVLGTALMQALTPLLEELPNPRFRVRWDEDLQLWTSEFQELLTDSNDEAGMNKPAEKEPLFSLGRVVATPGALAALDEAGQTASEFLYRHVTGDWGNLDAHDRRENELSLKQGSRILSAYQTNKGTRIWVITEWDRSVTTLLLPMEY